MAESSIPITMRFLANAEDVMKETGRMASAFNRTFTSLGTLAAKAAGHLNAANLLSVASTGLLVAELVKVGSVAAGSIGSAVTSIEQLGKKSLETATKFQSLKARIAGLKGDSEAAQEVFNEAVGFSFKTPFDVDEIVAATATLESFGQGGKKNLELVANIAASTNQDLQATALRTAKALSGISEGFQGLRDASGITAAKLGDAGAALADINNVSLQSKGEIEAARQALYKLGQTQFAEGIARQNQTLGGALANVSHAADNFYNVMGEALAPGATIAARALSGVIVAATDLIEPFAGAVAYTGLLVTGMVNVVGAIGPVGAVIGGIALKSFVLNRAIGALTGTTGGLTGAFTTLGGVGPVVSTVMARSRAAVVALGNATIFAAGKAYTLSGALATAAASAKTFALSSLGLAIGGIGLAFGTAAIAAKLYQDRMKELGDAVTEASRRSTAATHGFRELNDLARELSGTEISLKGTLGADISKLQQALDSMEPTEVFAQLRAAGEDVASLSSKLEANQKQVEATKRKMVELQAALDEARTAEFERGLASDSARVAELELQVGGLVNELKGLAGSRAIIEAFLGSMEKVPAALAAVAAESKQLQGFMRFAGGLDDLDQMRAALSVMEDGVRGLGANLVTATGTLDKFQLGLKLLKLDPEGDEAKAIQAYLDGLDQVEAMRQKVSDGAKAAADEEIKAFELVTARRKALGELSTQQELDRIQQELDMVQQGTAAEIGLLQEKARLKEQIAREALERDTALIEQQVKAAEEKLGATTSTPDVTAKQTSAALRVAITELTAFRQAHLQAFRDAPEAAEAFRRKMVDLNRDLDASKAKELEEAFKALKQQIEADISIDGSGAQQLEQLATSIGTLKAAINSSTVDQAGAEQLLVDLQGKQKELLQQQADLKLRMADEIAALELQAVQEEIALLEQRRDAGENVERQITEAKQRELDARMAAVERAYEAEVKANGDSVEAQRIRQLKIDQIARAQTKTMLDEATKQATIARQPLPTRAQSRSGGTSPSSGNSYGISPFSGGSFFGGIQAPLFSEFAEGFGRKRVRAPEPPNFAAIQRRAEASVKQQQAVRQGSTSTLPSDHGLTKSVTHHTTINVNGQPANPNARELARQAQVVYMDEDRRRSLYGKGGKGNDPIQVGDRR